MDPLDKPAELLAAREAAEELFELLRRWFGVPAHVTVDLRAVDSAVAELADPLLVMAMAMRKLQAFHLLTTPGVVTTTDVVLTVVQDLERALDQAPRMRLRNQAAATDWDAALAALEEGETPEDFTALADDEIEEFRQHHRALREAARAVLRVSEGKIRRLR